MNSLNLLDLPDEMLLEVMKKLSRDRDLPILAKTCSKLWSLASDNSLYRGEDETVLATKNLWNRRYKLTTVISSLKNHNIRDLFSIPNQELTYLLNFTNNTFQLLKLNSEFQMTQSSLNEVPTNIFTTLEENQQRISFASEACHRQWVYGNRFEEITLSDPTIPEEYSYTLYSKSIRLNPPRGDMKKFFPKKGEITGVALFGKYLALCAGGSLHMVDRKRLKVVKSFNRFYNAKGVTVINRKKIAVIDDDQLKVLDFSKPNMRSHLKDKIYDHKSARTARLVMHSAQRGFKFTSLVFSSTPLLKEFVKLSGKISLICGAMVGGVVALVGEKTTLLATISATAMTALTCFTYTFVAYLVVFSVKIFFTGAALEFKNHQDQLN